MLGGHQIEQLGPEDRAEAVRVLSASFRAYPVMRFALADAGSAYERHLEQLIGFFCDARFTRDWPVLGIRDAGELVAVALLSEPVVTPRPPELQRRLDRVAQVIGQAAMERMDAYEAASSGHEPDDPHYFLGMIGVHPDHQGLGHGRALLDHVHATSEADAGSTGVALSTEDPANVPFYEKAGYRVVGEADVGGVHTWSMFRSDLST